MRTVRSVEKLVRLRDGRTRRFRTTVQRRRIVEETLKPGASVALIARDHDVNTNQVFKWRRMYRKGQLEMPPSNLLPVKITDEVSVKVAAAKRSRLVKSSGVIDIDLGHARVRIEGAADPNCVRSVLEGLCR
jgi:transposase